MKNCILVTGSTGFIGSHFVQQYNELYDLITPNHTDLDILDTQKLQSLWKKYKPNIIINFAAHRDANSAELQRGDTHATAWQTNVEGVKNLSTISEKYNTYFIQISTDMVFAGSNKKPGPYKEIDIPERDASVISWYGYTKAEGERVVAYKDNTAIIRIGNVTQPVYDPKLDYVGKILYLYDKQMLYPLFFDQNLSLTWIPTLFLIIEKLIVTRKTGIFHATSKNVFTPYELGDYIIRQKRDKEAQIQKMSIDSFLTKSPHRYPKFGGLDGVLTSKSLGTKLLTWKEIVDSFIL